MQMLPLTVVYTAGDETIGTQVLKANGLEGEEHTFTSKGLVAPENYEFVEAFAGYPVAYGANAEVTVEVRKIELPTPGDEEADATLHISYIFNYRELANQDITVRGKKGESYTFTSENVSLEIPTGYKLKKAMDPVEVLFGDTHSATIPMLRAAGIILSGRIRWIGTISMLTAIWYPDGSRRTAISTICTMFMTVPSEECTADGTRLATSGITSMIPQPVLSVLWIPTHRFRLSC